MESRILGNLEVRFGGRLTRDPSGRSQPILHHWCVGGDLTRLEGCKAWLAAHIVIPSDEREWRQLGTDAVDWLTALPAEWEPHWRMLSSRECTLTVEALEMLEACRPGAIAAALTQDDPSPESAPPWFENLPLNWSLSEVLRCVEREVARREADYRQQVERGRLSPENARHELGQMKAAVNILRSMQANGQDARQGSLFEKDI